MSEPKENRGDIVLDLDLLTDEEREMYHRLQVGYASPMWIVYRSLIETRAALAASQSRERVYREALEVTVEALDNLVGQLPTDGRLTEFQLDLQEQALVVARAALTNNKLDEEKE